MNKYLFVKYNPKRDKVLNDFENIFYESKSNSDVELLELSMDNLEFFNEDSYEAYITRQFQKRDLSQSEKKRLEKFDQLADQVKSADKIVLMFGINNFSLPAAIKAWIDMVGIGNVAFTMDHSKGHSGLLEDKEVLVLNTSAAARKGSSLDLSTPVLQMNFKFWGIKKIKYIGAYGVRVSEIDVEEINNELKTFLRTW